MKTIKNIGLAAIIAASATSLTGCMSNGDDSVGFELPTATLTLGGGGIQYNRRHQIGMGKTIGGKLADNTKNSDLYGDNGEGFPYATSSTTARDTGSYTGRKAMIPGSYGPMEQR